MIKVVYAVLFFQLFFVFFVKSEEWTSIQQMNAEFERRFTDKDALSIDQWNAALPTKNERKEIETLIDFLLSVSTFENLSPSILLSNYQNLRKSINITFYKTEYAIIHEIYNSSDFLPFKRYFGYTVIASKAIASNPYLHHAAPHFKFDGNVCNQSAAIFEETFSRSLVIAGAHRYAVRDRQPPNPCQTAFAIADPAHNNLTMFHAFNEAILAASKRQSQFNLTPYFFIQWHGMSEESCPNTPVFISTGASGNDSIYLNSSLPANKLKDAYGNGAKTPIDDPECNLAATTNVFGRLVDGIDKEEVCEKSAKNISGNFIHIEQKKKERNDWNGWIKAVTKAFNLKNCKFHLCFSNNNVFKETGKNRSFGALRYFYLDEIVATTSISMKGIAECLKNATRILIDVKNMEFEYDWPLAFLDNPIKFNLITLKNLSFNLDISSFDRFVKIYILNYSYSSPNRTNRV